MEFANTSKLSAVAAIALASCLSAAAASGYPAETKNLRPDSARDLCLDLARDAKLQPCNGASSQRIILTQRNDGKRVMRVGKDCVEGNREGEALFLTTCRSVDTQTWTYNSNGQIKNGNGLCVDVFMNEKRAGTPVITYRCNGTVNQRWARYAPEKSEAEKNRASNVTLHPGHASGKCLDATPDGRLVLWTCHGGENQKFSFTFGITSIIRTRSGCLTVTPDNTVAVSRCTQSSKQAWIVERNGTITNGGNCLDVRMADKNDGTPLLRFKCTGAANQRFAAR
jgi:hypothetical protein